MVAIGKAVDRLDEEVDAFKLQVENRTKNGHCESKPWDRNALKPWADPMANSELDWMKAKMNKQERHLHMQQVTHITPNTNACCRWCGSASCTGKGYLIICLQLAINTGFLETEFTTNRTRILIGIPDVAVIFKYSILIFRDQLDGVNRIPVTRVLKVFLRVKNMRYFKIKKE
jgi:hypothetical protein